MRHNGSNILLRGYCVILLSFLLLASCRNQTMAVSNRLSIHMSKDTANSRGTSKNSINEVIQIFSDTESVTAEADINEEYEDITATVDEYYFDDNDAISDSSGVYTQVSVMPQFPDGFEALIEYLSIRQVYPAGALADSIQGRVIIQFVVEKDGSISNVNVEKSVHPLLDAEAIRLITGMPKWTPGKCKGEVCRVKYRVPINFRL